MSVRWIIGDTRDVVAAMPDDSVDLVLTSPPFLALRSYLPPDHPDKWREIGTEATPATFIDTLLALTAEWGRVLTPTGTLAVELGDTYSGSSAVGGDEMRSGRGVDGTMRLRGANEGITRGRDGWPLAKSLALVPESYRLALAYGRNPLTGDESPAGRWRVRNVVDWCRPNPPVGALGDKFRPSTSDLVIACRAKDRWFDLDAVREPASPNTNPRTAKGVDARRNDTKSGDDERTGGNRSSLAIQHSHSTAPPLDHWIIPPGGYSGSHYAVFPPELCRIPVESMCPRRVCRTCGTPSRREVEASEGYAEKLGGTIAGRVGKAAESGLLGSTQPPGDHITSASYTTTGWSTCGCPGTDGIRLDGYHTGPGWRPGIVLDPFGGSGTTGMVASGLSRDAICVDVDDRNADLARSRIGMFLEVEDQRKASA